MRMMRRSCVAVWMLSLAMLLLAAGMAGATVSHPDYFGPNYSFTSIQETSTFGDPEPLFGAPLGVGDSLLFSLALIMCEHSLYTLLVPTCRKFALSHLHHLLRRRRR